MEWGHVDKSGFRNKFIIFPYHVRKADNSQHWACFKRIRAENWHSYSLRDDELSVYTPWYVRLGWIN